MNISPDPLKAQRVECLPQHQLPNSRPNAFPPNSTVTKSDPKFSNIIFNVLPLGIANDLMIQFNHS